MTSSQHDSRTWGGRSKQVVAWVVVSAALLYLAYIAIPDAGSVQTLFRNVGKLQVASSILCAIPMLLIASYYHAGLVDRMSATRVSFGRISSTYLQAQLVRYLPGKIWGLVYQSQQLHNEYKPEVVVVANLSQMLMTSILAFGIVSCTLAAAWWRSPWPLLVLVPTLGLVEFLHRNPRAEQWAISLLGRLVPTRLYHTSPIAMAPSRWAATILLLLEWVFFYLMIIVLLSNVMSFGESFILASWYAGASLLAVAAIVVPAGFAIREAIFVSAASLLPGDPSTLIAIAALLRVCSIIAEILAAAISTAAHRLYSYAA